MGHSAGAHLAMLYAYTYPKQVDLLIAEAAPTKFVDENMEVLHVDPAICAMTGIPYRGEGYVYAPNDKNNPNANRDFNEITALRNASPLWIAHDYITAQKAKSSSQQDPLPYSVFAYGGMDLNQDGIIDPNATDGVIPVSHLTDLTAFLDKNSYQSFLFPNVFHSHFGIGDASNSIFVNPNTTNPMIRSYYYGKYDGEELTIPGLKQIIQEKLFN